MKHGVLYTFLFFINLFVFLECKLYQLELVQVLMRHGQRTPSSDEIKLYPNDCYNVSTYEPWGPGHLTNKGKDTEYRIGKILRQRYDELLGPIYYPGDIYAYSTDSDRTKTSLNLMLAGLLPPQSVQMWNPKLPWFPIPTYYAPIKTDKLLKFLVCPKYNDIFTNVLESQEVRDKIAVYKDFFNFLSNKTGSNVTDLRELEHIFQLFTAQKAMNLTMPEWYTDKVEQQLENGFALLRELYSYTTELKRFTGGMIIKMFIDNLTDRTYRKMYVYAGHDLNIGCFLRAHNISQTRINYGSTIIFETLRNKHGKLYIKILWLNGIEEKIVTLKLANCNERCPLNVYTNLIKDVIPSDAEINCPVQALSMNYKL